MLYYNPNLKHNARKLRKKMTEAETLLWSRIRRKQLQGLQFYRQRVIGNYITDFYCPKAKLVIEVDGGQHGETEARKRDRVRDAYLQKLGLRVLRFWAGDVMKNVDGVLQEIYESL